MPKFEGEVLINGKEYTITGEFNSKDSMATQIDNKSPSGDQFNATGQTNVVARVPSTKRSREIISDSIREIQKIRERTLKYAYTYK